MKLGDLKNLVTMPPKRRAAQCLSLGAELQKVRKKTAPMGKLPAPLKRETVQDSPVGQLMMRLHGIKGDIPKKVVGLR